MSRRTSTGPPLWLGLVILVVAPFVVLAAVIHRAPTLGAPRGSVLVHTGQSYVSSGEELMVYLPAAQRDRTCWLFDDNDRALRPATSPDSLQTVVAGHGYVAVLGYRAEPGAVITVNCDVDPSIPILITPPITRQSALLPVAVGGVLGFVMIGFGTVMLVNRRRALQEARRSERFDSDRPVGTGERPVSDREPDRT